ncbi:MAG: hypothetical protein OXU20_26645 [Myxococcales bacterium]|nr:hypothetical protein [Myxococcales bacterium]
MLALADIYLNEDPPAARATPTVVVIERPAYTATQSPHCAAVLRQRPWCGTHLARDDFGAGFFRKRK